MFIEAKKLNSICEGSLEQIIEERRNILREAKGDGWNIIATHEGESVVIDDSGKFYTMNVDNKGELQFEEKEIPVIEHVEGYVSAELDGIFNDLVKGEDVRTRVHELSKVINKEDMYWVSDIVEAIDESMSDRWITYYDDLKSDIRKALYGKLQKTEEQVPKTRFSKLSDDRLIECSNEINESLNILSKLMSQIVDECRELVFDSDRDELSVIKESLTGEASKVENLLNKAKRLLLSKVSREMTETHDKLSERAKTMMVVSEYLKESGTRDTRSKSDGKTKDSNHNNI